MISAYVLSAQSIYYVSVEGQKPIVVFRGSLIFKA